MCPGSIPASLAVIRVSMSGTILRSTCGEQLVYLRLGVPVSSSLEQATFLNGRGGRNPSERGMFAMGGLRFMHACIYFSICLRCTRSQAAVPGQPTEDVTTVACLPPAGMSSWACPSGGAPSFRVLFSCLFLGQCSPSLRFWKRWQR